MKEKKNVERDPTLWDSREDRSCMEVGEVQRRTLRVSSSQLDVMLDTIRPVPQQGMS